MPIPLLRLPLLAFEEVIQNMRPRELFFLSLCSKRMSLVVKKMRDKSIKLAVSLRIGKNIEINLLNKKHPYHPLLDLTVQEMPKDHQEGWRTEQFRGTLFREDSFLRSFWIDVDVGTRSLLEYMSDLFCAPISNLKINGYRNFWVLDWVEERQAPGSYEASVNDPNGFTDEQYRHLLVDLHPSQLYVKTRSEMFRVTTFSDYDKTSFLFEGTWKTIENLLQVDGNLLTFDKPFAVAEMNQLLRYLLIDGEALPGQSDFRARLQFNYDSKEILDGVSDVLTPIRGMEQFEENRAEWKFNGCPKKDRSVHVSIACFRNVNLLISFKKIEA